MAPPFTIRAFRPGDEFAICELHVAAIRAIPETVYSHSEVDGWARGKTPEIYVRIQQDPGEIVIVAVDGNDRPVGFCGYLGDEIRGMYVDPAWQGQGVGAALMTTAETEIAASGAERYRVLAARSAYGFYQRLGYAQVSIASHTLHNGQKIEAAWHEKPNTRRT